jgi:hypothetical protein
MSVPLAQITLGFFERTVECFFNTIYSDCKFYDEGDKHITFNITFIGITATDKCSTNV